MNYTTWRAGSLAYGVCPLMSTTEQKTACRFERWRSRLGEAFLLTVLLAVVIDGVYSAVIERIPEGKLGERQRLFSLNTLLYFGMCFVLALGAACLRKAVRYPVRGAIGGAFVGYIGAMIFSRIRYGWGEITWTVFHAGIREGAAFTIPVAMLLGICVGVSAALEENHPT